MESLDAGRLMKTQLPVRQTTRSGGKRAAPPPVRASNAPDELTTSSVTPARKAKVADHQMVMVDEFSQPDATPPSAALRIVQSAVVFRALHDQGAQSSSARLDAAASPLRGRHRECGLEGKQQRQRSKEQKGRAALSCGPTPRPLAPRTCARPNPPTTLSHATCPLPCPARSRAAAASTSGNEREPSLLELSRAVEMSYPVGRSHMTLLDESEVETVFGAEPEGFRPAIIAAIASLQTERVDAEGRLLRSPLDVGALLARMTRGHDGQGDGSARLLAPHAPPEPEVQPNRASIPRRRAPSTACSPRAHP